MKRQLVIVGLAALASAGATSPAGAFDLVVGRWGVLAPDADGARVDTSPSAPPPVGGPPVAVLNFTPRAAGEGRGAAPRLQLELSLAPAAPDRLTSLEFGRSSGSPSWLEEPDDGGGLTVGGALRWDDWMIGGAYERTDLVGEPAELVAASVGYGPLVASFALGQAERADEPPLDVLMLSTDLLAWSWLALESDMAVGDGDQDDESVAVGRVGLKLSF